MAKKLLLIFKVNNNLPKIYFQLKKGFLKAFFMDSTKVHKYFQSILI